MLKYSMLRVVFQGLIVRFYAQIWTAKLEILYFNWRCNCTWL